RPMRADALRNRAKIVEAAKAAFSERGLETQMEDVARRAGVGVGTLYRHFPTKDALVRALIVDKMERMADAAKAALEAEDADPWEAFAGVLWQGAEQQVRDRSLAQVVATQPQESFRSAVEDETALAERLNELLRRAQEAGVVRPDVGPDDIPTVMCGLGAVVQNGRDWRRYLQLMLDGFRNHDCGRLHGP
ncbi:MAG TPA: TetR family transcriptional regulator, partial [Solirubrobacteraceae bacterium]|nr:TetR family transcriptional regulator [Solirubrobacteraceae bacterium]